MSDAITIRPRLKPRKPGPVAVEARTRRQEDAAGRRPFLAQLRRLAIRRRATRAAVAGVRRVTPGGANLFKVGAGLKLIAASVIVGGITRAVTGRTLNSIESSVNEGFLGGLDDQARASARARESLFRPDVLAFAGLGDAQRAQLVSVYQDNYNYIENPKAQGRRSFDNDSRFDVENRLDQLITAMSNSLGATIRSKISFDSVVDAFRAKLVEFGFGFLGSK